MNWTACVWPNDKMVGRAVTISASYNQTITQWVTLGIEDHSLIVQSNKAVAFNRQEFNFVCKFGIIDIIQSVTSHWHHCFVPMTNEQLIWSSLSLKWSLFIIYLWISVFLNLSPGEFVHWSLDTPYLPISPYLWSMWSDGCGVGDISVLIDPPSLMWR